MEPVGVKRLDHHGVVACVIDDLKMVEIIDERIPSDGQEEVTVGEAVKAMIQNGLGFSNRALMLTPQFYENLPMDLLFREGVEANHFNRHKLGRSLDRVYEYGPDLLFSEIALQACHQEGIDRRFNSLDTTAFSLCGEYAHPGDPAAIRITLGHSKDHRPDLKQAVLEMIVAQDGGVPFCSKSWDGNASDSVIFRERAEALIEEFKNSDTPRYLVADSKLYAQNSAPFLVQIPFITRIPANFALEKQLIRQALRDPSAWVAWDPDYRYQRIELGHYGIDQRWLVIYSQGALERARQSLAKAQKKEHKEIQKQLSRLAAQRFDSPKAAQQGLEKISRGPKYHQIVSPQLIPHKSYAQRGRPGPNTPVTAIRWQIRAELAVDEPRIEQLQHAKACFILATNIPERELSDAEVFAAYKNQSSVERGFRFLKDPLFFVSSLFLKKPSRIQGLLMVMTLSLLVYAIAQRRLRAELKKRDETLPNQIDIPTARPTLRWIFQALEGIHRVTVITETGVRVLVQGVTELRTKILQLLGPAVCQKYQIPVPEG
jgi:transposase